MWARRIASASAFALMSATGAAGAAYGLKASVLMFFPLFLCHPFGDWRFGFVQRLADDIDQRRPIRSQRLLQHSTQFGRLRHAPALHTERFRHPGMIRHPEVHREIALAVAGLLPGLDPAVHGVRDHDESDRQPEA